jgi:hypothetical protein
VPDNPLALKNYSSLALVDSFLDVYVDKNLVTKVMNYGSLPAELLDSNDDDASADERAPSGAKVVYESLPVPPQRSSPEIVVEWNESERPPADDMELCGESEVFEPLAVTDEMGAILDQLLDDDEATEPAEQSSDVQTRSPE